MKRTAKACILVVEDDPAILQGLLDVLVFNGYEAVGVEDGAEGLKTALENNFDLIILDLMLPDMDGTEFCRTLKRKEKTRHIPVIMVTAKAEEVDRVVGLELGADDYVVKPFSTRELTLRVKGVLRRRNGPKEDKKVLTHGEVFLDV